MNKRKINVVYYSGTGGTTRVAQSFEKVYKELVKGYIWSGVRKYLQD